MQKMLDNTCVVLVEPTHPGNIGAVARAMKTMGIVDLCLVKPAKFPHVEATQRSAGADDVLVNARVVDTLDEALADRTLVIGTSVREREVTWPTKYPKQAADFVLDATLNSAELNRTAILFGRESSGLTNAELDLCNFQIVIPSDADYSSLNLGSAVQIICYEFRQAALTQMDHSPVPSKSLSPAQLRQLPADKVMRAQHIEHLHRVLEGLDFIKYKPPTMLIRKLTRLYNKADLSIEEIHILRGVLTAIEQNIERKSDK